jgi:Holliday junction resolvase RusA-like endonuclease
MYRPAGGGRRVLSPEAVAFYRDVAAVVVPAGWTPPAAVPLGLVLDLYPPDKRRRDASNLIKLTEDAIFGALGEDDVRVVHLEIRKHAPDPQRPRIEARLSAVLGADRGEAQ